MRNRVIPILLLLTVVIPQALRGQQQCRLSFSDDGQPWAITLNDSLMCASGDTLELAAGRYILEARPAYDYRWPGPYIRDTLLLKAGTVQNYALFDGRALRLEKAPGALSPVPARPLPDLSAAVFYKKPLFKNGLLAGAILGNWAAFYSKRLADQSYQSYLRSSRQDDISRYYRQSRSYDRLSNVMLGLSVATLSAYFWLLIED